MPFEGAEYAQGRITGMDAEGMTMAGYVDALGTHMGIRRLTVEDGKLVTVGDGLWHFEYDLQSEETWAQQALTAKTAVPVTLCGFDREGIPGGTGGGNKDTDHRHRRRFPGMVHRAGRPQGLFDHSAR